MKSSIRLLTTPALAIALAAGLVQSAAADYPDAWDRAVSGDQFDAGVQRQAQPRDLDRHNPRLVPGDQFQRR